MESIDQHSLRWGFVCVVGAALAGVIWSTRPDTSPNDRSRWNTVWSLVDFGTYQIFPTPEQAEKYGKPKQFPTIDRVMVYEEGEDRSDPAAGRCYSSKPPLLPTLIACYVKVLQTVVGEDFGEEVKRPRWQALHIYTKATLYTFQLLPFLLMVLMYGRFLATYGESDFTRVYCLLAAGLGTYVTGYLVTLNNHVIGAWSGFLTAYLAIQIVYEQKHAWWRFFLTGVLAGWTAVNELPAGLFVLAVIGILFVFEWRNALVGLLPGLAIVTAAFFVTNYQAIGYWKPAYLVRDLYEYPGSHFSEQFEQPNKSAIDALNDNPESLPVYLLHMTIGHHGLFSLTPIWILAAWGAVRFLKGDESRLRGLHWPLLFVTAGVFAFFWIFNSQRNYGGHAHGMRWLMWLSPLWLLVLPAGVETVAKSRGGRILAYLLLAISIFSAFETMNAPWTYSWLHNLLLYLKMVNY